jgi:signal transduction histidine kinase
VTLVRERISVESVVQAAVASSHDKLTVGGHQLDVDVPDERLFIRGDRDRLAQALSHLIINAAKFTFQPNTVTIGVRRAAKTVHISVKDRGEGSIRSSCRMRSSCSRSRTRAARARSAASASA